MTKETTPEKQKPVEPIKSSQWQGELELTHFKGKTDDKGDYAVTCQPTIRWVALKDECEEVGVIRIHPQQKTLFSIENPNTEFSWSLARIERIPRFIKDAEGLQKVMQESAWEMPEQFDAALSIVQRLSAEHISQNLLIQTFSELTQLPGFVDNRAQDAQECTSWGRNHDHSNLV